MGLISGVFNFGKGSVLGAAIGIAAGVLLAPGSGRDVRDAAVDRVQRTRKAGVDAKAATEQEMINRFRGTTQSSDALEQIHELSKADQAAGLAHIDATKPDF